MFHTKRWLAACVTPSKMVGIDTDNHRLYKDLRDNHR
jgi:hypothetical protein